MIQVINLQDWLSLFNISLNERPEKVSKDYFYNNFKVAASRRTVSIREYMDKFEETRKEDINVLIDMYNNRDKYLLNFYERSLKVSNNSLESLWNKTKNNENDVLFDNNKNKTVKNLIRNLHFEDILMNTLTDIPNLKPFLKVLYDFYNKQIIDYKLLTPSVISLIKKGGLGSVLSGIYFRASIMNPYLVYTISKKFIKKPNSRIFTPTLGWSSYIYGFLENENVSEYLGIDVIDDVCKKTKNVFSSMYPSKKIEILCEPSESIFLDKKTIKPYKSKFDLAFFSPPYYRLELYPGDKQSTTNYKTYDEWLQNYWRNTIRLCDYVLKNNTHLVYILSGYGSENDTTYKLNEDMNNITKSIFEYIGEIPMYNSNVNFTKHRKANEIIYIFKKK